MWRIIVEQGMGRQVFDGYPSKQSAELHAIYVQKTWPYAKIWVELA